MTLKLACSLSFPTADETDRATFLGVGGYVAGGWQGAEGQEPCQMYPPLASGFLKMPVIR